MIFFIIYFSSFNSIYLMSLIFYKANLILIYLHIYHLYSLLFPVPVGSFASYTNNSYCRFVDDKFTFCLASFFLNLKTSFIPFFFCFNISTEYKFIGKRLFSFNGLNITFHCLLASTECSACCSNPLKKICLFPLVFLLLQFHGSTYLSAMCPSMVCLFVCLFINFLGTPWIL